MQAKSRGKHAPEPEPTLALGYCKKCDRSNAFCSCNSQLDYDPLDLWASNSNSPKWFEPRKRILERFCFFTGRNVFALIDIARKHAGQPQFKLSEYLSKYLEWRAAPVPIKPDDPPGCGIAKSTVAKEAGSIAGFFARACDVRLMVPKKFRGMESVYEGTRILTQLEVHQMIKCATSLLEMSVVCLASQLGQRIGILTALRYDMIQKIPEDPRWGYVEMKGDYKDFEGNPVGRKVSSHYCFLIHPESMMLIEKLRKEQEDKSEYVFTIGIRKMQTIFDNCAKRAGLQKKQKHLRNKNEIHIHIQRAFFMNQMMEGHATEGLDTKTAEHLLDFFMGHKGPYGMTYLRGLIQEGKLLAAYKRAEDKLCVVSLPKQRGLVKP